MNNKPCFCGSGEDFSKCCRSYYTILDLRNDYYKKDTLLLDWLSLYSEPIKGTFLSKTSTFIFRISIYLDNIIDKYTHLGFPRSVPGDKRTFLDESILGIKSNIILSLNASITCLSQGLFLQSGMLLRSVIEDSLVLIDIAENDEQAKKFIEDKYSTNKLISRVKKYIPNDIVVWYGDFSANFAHFGPLHPSPYLPRACYEDNFVIVIGLQGFIRAIVALHIILERIYFKATKKPYFWGINANDVLEFNNDSKVLTWANNLTKEMASKYPPNERKKAYVYSERSYKLKV
jgi:hypothetical protein